MLLDKKTLVILVAFKDENADNATEL
jgi:hypothetical protein